MTKSSWSDAKSIVATLQKRWSSGKWLSEHAQGATWQPQSVSITTPQAAELLDRIDEVQQWVAALERDAARLLPGCEIVYKDVRNRSMGRNRLPQSIVVPSFDVLISVLGKQLDVETFYALHDLTAHKFPSLIPWMHTRPLVVVEHAAHWHRYLAVIDWISTNRPQHRYLRHIDALGVDTKFIEAHRKVLGQLLDLTLPSLRVADDVPATDIAGRFGFLQKPSYIRLRLGTQAALATGMPKGISELSIRIEELSALNLRCERVFILENEITYLAFPLPEDCICVFGSGFRLANLHAAPALNDLPLFYWGDIDTHGFAILDQLRQRFANVTSFLMDTKTLLDHEPHWTIETQTQRSLHHLRPDEQALYQDLIEDRYGPNIRLEQERIRFKAITRSLL